MNESELIHEQSERKASLYWWITSFPFYIVGMLLSASIIVAPFLILLQLWNYRVLLLFIAVPVGWWIMKMVYRNLSKLVWHNRHISSYRLEDGQFTYSEWDKKTRMLKRDRVSFDAIAYIVSSYFVLEDNHFYPKKKIRSFVPQKNMAEVLYIVYTKDEQSQMASVPFYPNELAIDTWMHSFQDHQIPLYQTNDLIYNDDENERLDFFENVDDSLIPFTLEKNKQDLLR